MHIKKDDMIQVVSGDDKGKQGRVLKVFPEQKKIIVEGVNFVKHHTKPNQKMPQGGIIEKEAPIHASNAMVLCPKCSNLTKTGMKAVEDKTKKTTKRFRYCKKCGEMLVPKSV